MSPRTNSTVLTTRDTIAQLLNEIGETLAWPVRLALSSAFNHLDDTVPTLAPPPKPPSMPPGEPSECPDVVARVEALRAALMRLLEDLPDDVDPYAVGHAAGELGTALRELAQGRPA